MSARRLIVVVLGAVRFVQFVFEFPTRKIICVRHLRLRSTLGELSGSLCTRKREMYGGRYLCWCFRMVIGGGGVYSVLEKNFPL